MAKTLLVFNPFTGTLDYIERVSVRDEGADQGAVTAIDFVGASVTVTVAAGVATVAVAASEPDFLAVQKWNIGAF